MTPCEIAPRMLFKISIPTLGSMKFKMSGTQIVTLSVVSSCVPLSVVEAKAPLGYHSEDQQDSVHYQDQAKPQTDVHLLLCLTFSLSTCLCVILLSAAAKAPAVVQHPKNNTFLVTASFTVHLNGHKHHDSGTESSLPSYPDGLVVLCVSLACFPPRSSPVIVENSVVFDGYLQVSAPSWEVKKRLPNHSKRDLSSKTRMK